MLKRAFIWRDILGIELFKFLKLRSLNFKFSFVIIGTLLAVCAFILYFFTTAQKETLIDSAKNELQAVASKQASLLRHVFLLHQQNVDDLSSMFQTQLPTVDAQSAWDRTKAAIYHDKSITFFLGDDKRVFASSEQWQTNMAIELDLSSLMFYPSILNSSNKMEQWTPVYYDDILHQWLITYGNPIKQDEQLVGVFASGLQVDPIIQEASQIENQDVEVFIYDRLGNIIYHPDYGSRLIRQVDSLGTPGQNNQLIRQSLVQFIEQNKADGSIQTFKDWGKKVLASSRRVNVNGWVIVAYQTESSMLKGQFETVQPLMVTLAIIVLVCLILVVLLTKYMLSNRLRNTTSLLTRASAGHFEFQPEVKSLDEIDELNNHINKLFTRFNARQAEHEAEMVELRQSVESNKALAQAVSFSDSAVILLELDFMVSFVDSKSLSLLKCEREDIMHTRFFNYIHEHMAFISEQIVNEIRRKQSWRGELVLKNQENGDQIWVNVTITPMRNDHSVVTKYVVSMQDISFIKDSQNKIEKLAYTDELTNLANRTFFIAQLEKLVEIAKRGRYEFALLYFDVDDFNRVNDHYGHEGGDQMLMELSARLSEHLRNEDVLARMGGDEFALIMGGAHSEQDVLVMANNILSMMQQPFVIRSQEVQATTSIGITMSSSDEADPEVLLQHADLAMYEAKSLGKNTFHFYTKELNEAAKERQTIERALHQAIRDHKLQLHYQPKVDFSQGKLIGYEALLRWIDDELGFVSPAKFVPIAEQSNLILKLGSWVMEEAIRFAGTLEQDTPVSINLSARQFDSGDCVEELRQLLEKYELPAQMIEIEITESHLVSDVEGAIVQLHDMKALGVHISIDDFGTGYSSLSYLKRFPVDTLKIDRSFIKDIPDDINDVEITGAIIAMAQKLGLQVIAEGAETQAQIDFLRDNECYLVQGYFFSKPLPEAEARAYVFSES